MLFVFHWSFLAEVVLRVIIFNVPVSIVIRLELVLLLLLRQSLVTLHKRHRWAFQENHISMYFFKYFYFYSYLSGSVLLIHVDVIEKRRTTKFLNKNDRKTDLFFSFAGMFTISLEREDEKKNSNMSSRNTASWVIGEENVSFLSRSAYSTSGQREIICRWVYFSRCRGENERKRKEMEPLTIDEHLSLLLSLSYNLCSKWNLGDQTFFFDWVRPELSKFVFSFKKNISLLIVTIVLSSFIMDLTRHWRTRASKCRSRQHFKFSLMKLFLWVSETILPVRC